MAVTNTLATAYSNQKKLVALSTGRMVSVIADITTYARFLWSDDGQTWTDYAQDILGWSDGSIARYVDSGGIERIIATWKQSGTGGSRTDGWTYAMVGTLNAGRTTITWGTALVIYGGTGGFRPDIVVNAEGTGGRSHVVLAFLSGTTNQTIYMSQTITSAGAMSETVSSTVIGGSYNITLYTRPSIDINPTTKDLYCAWSAGATGAGLGIRFKKATYSAGVWTWGTEVEVDTTRYISGNDYQVTCRWDGTRVVLGGLLFDATNYDLMLYETTNFTSFTTRLLADNTTTTHWTSFASTVVDADTGDVYFIGRPWANSGGVHYIRWNRATTALNLGVVTDSTYTPSNAPYVNAIYSNYKIRWIYTAGNNSPYQVKYDELNLITDYVSGSDSVSISVSETSSIDKRIFANSTNTSATERPTQKKLLALSTGRLVAVVGDTTTNAQFWHSVDGKTWTNYSADILGWSNGSIAAYVDSGGIERIIATWKQVGTGGSRTTQYGYVMVGTLNAGRTTITWGTANAFDTTIYGTGHDIVVNTEGTGGRSHVVFTYNDGATSKTHYGRQSIDSAGTLTIDLAQSAISNSYAVNAHTFPSVAINPTTKDLYCSWSAGATGAGLGIRFKKATYSAGVWTWGSEIEIDTTRRIFNTLAHLTCLWDGTRVVLAGLVSDSVMVYESTNFTSFTTRVLDAGPRYLYSGSSSIDTSNGNIYIFGEWVAPTDIQYYKWTRATTTLSSRITTDVGPNNATNANVNVMLYNGYLRWIYTTGNGSPYQIKYDELNLAVPISGTDTSSMAVSETSSVRATTTIATSTTATATAYSNQRKIDRCQNGVLWSMWSGDFKVPKESYSTDNGTTWTTISSAIGGGFENCSFFIDLDDYAHVVYKDTGDLTLYYRRGTPNAGRTAWTWSAATSVNNTNTSIDYPDIVAHREGTGWAAHIIYSYDTSVSYTQYNKISITSGAVISVGARDDIGGNYGGAGHTYPSIDFNHTGDGKTVAGSTPHLYVAWSAGTSGAGKGLRFKKATYSAGVWTWGTERELFPGNFDYPLGVSLVFDGSNAIIAWTTNYVKLQLCSRNAADTTTFTYSYAADSNASQLDAQTPTVTADAGFVYVYAKPSSPTNTLKYVKVAKNTAGNLAWTGTISSTAANAYPSAKRGYSNNRIEVIYTDATASPYNVTYGSIDLPNIIAGTDSSSISISESTQITGNTTLVTGVDSATIAIADASTLLINANMPGADSGTLAVTEISNVANIVSLTPALTRNHTGASTKTTGATIAATIATADTTIGNTLIAWIGFDNLSATTPITNSISKPGGETALWVKIAEHDSSIATAAAGNRGEMWAIKTTVAWPVATAVTATLSASVDAKAILLSEYSNLTTNVRGTAGQGVSTAGTPSSVTSGISLVNGDFVVGGATFENNAAAGDDVDTTNGSWSAGNKINSTGGGAATNVAVITQYKVISVTGVQTYNPTGAADAGAAVVALIPEMGILLTGTDTGSLLSAESTVTLVSLTASDTVTISISETNASLRTIVVTDTSSVATTESATKFNDFPGQDSGTVSITETNDIFRTVPTSDSSSVEVAEAVSVGTNLTTPDTSSVSISETTNTLQLQTPQGTDSSSVSLAESSVSSLTATRPETSAIAITETNISSITVITTDTSSISITEINGFSSFFPGQENISIGVAETSTIIVTQTRADSSAVSIGDVSSAVVSPVNISDASSISISETTSFVRNIAVADTFSIAVAESATRFNDFPGQEAASISLVESRTIVGSSTRTDTSSVSLDESQTTYKTLISLESNSLTIIESATLSITDSKVGTEAFAISISSSQIVTLKSMTNAIGVIPRDSPVGLWQLDGGYPFTDYSGYNRISVITGVPTKGISLIESTVNSTVFTNTATGSFESPVFKQGREAQPFSLGVWFRVISTDGTYGEQQVVGHAGALDGIVVDGTVISFITKYLTAPESRTSYDLQVHRAVQVVGVHTSTKNSLYVDGELVAEVDITDEQKADSYIASNGNLYIGATTSTQRIAVNGLELYSKALSGSTILNHFISDSKVVGKSVVHQYGGTEIPLSKNLADVFLDQTWTTASDWNSAYLNGVVVERDGLVPQLIGGISIAGTWLDSVSLYNGDTPSLIDSANMFWDGEGAVVEVSIDAVTWETVVRGKNLTTIPAGFNPTGKELSIRVSFPGGITDDESYLDNMTITGFKTGVSPAGLRTVTYTQPAYVKNEYEPIELRDDWGTELRGGNLLISATTEPNPVHPKTLEVWVKKFDADAFATDFAGTVFYINGIAGTVMNVGEWAVFHIVSPTPVTAPINIVGDYQIGRIVLYEDSLNTTQISEIYASYTGTPVIIIEDSSAISVTEPALAANIYAFDWAIESAG